MDVTLLEERVARGAARLDEVDSDWYTKIDKPRLNISSSCDCTCGQWNDGKYSHGLARLRISPNEAREHGFNGSHLEYATLRQLWIQAIELRELLASAITESGLSPDFVVEDEQLLAV